MTNEDDKQGGSGSPAQNGNNVANVFKVSVKYSPFNREDPEIWFVQLEAQFGLGGITVDGTKYGHLLAALDSVTIKCVRDIVLNPGNENNKYENLKKAIIERLCDSAKSKLDQLLSGLQLGDKKPSQLLREMQSLSDNQINDNIIRNLWLQRLPTNIQEILSTMEDADLNKIAITADKIIEVNKPVGIFGIKNDSHSSTYSQSNHNSRSSEPYADLTKTVHALSERVEQLFKRTRDASKNRNPGSSRSHSPSRTNSLESKTRSSQSTLKHPYCWYHFKFGCNAKKCIKPCSFNQPRDHSNNSEN